MDEREEEREVEERARKRMKKVGRRERRIAGRRLSLFGQRGEDKTAEEARGDFCGDARTRGTYYPCWATAIDEHHLSVWVSGRTLLRLHKSRVPPGRLGETAPVECRAH